MRSPFAISLNCSALTSMGRRHGAGLCGIALQFRMTNLAVPGLGTFADVGAYMQGVGAAARTAARELARADTKAKNAALQATAAAIRADAARLLAANATDVAAAKAAGHDAAFVDRLTLTPKAVAAMADGLDQIAALPDPVGEITDLRYRPSGIQVGLMRVPLGVIGIVYESRPNVTADAAGLCLKAGNATILRGGSEASAQQPGDRGLRPRGPRRRRAAGDRGAGDRDHRPRGGRLPDRRREARRRHRPARRQGAHRAHLARGEGPGDQAPRRRLPRVHRRLRRPRDGDPHRRQREDAALFALQHDGDAAGARRHRRARAAAARRGLRGEGGRAARLRRARARSCRR